VHVPKEKGFYSWLKRGRKKPTKKEKIKKHHSANYSSITLFSPPEAVRLHTVITK